MTSLTNALAWIGGALALASPLLVWLAKRYIDHAVQLRFERLKAEHGVRFAWQHQQVTNVATDIHHLLVEAVNSLRYVAGSGYKIDAGPTPGDIKDLTETVGKLNQAFAKGSVFLPKPMRECIERVSAFLILAHNAVLQAKMFLDAGDSETMSKAMVNAFRLLSDEIDPIRTELELAFRQLLLSAEWGD